MEFTKMQKRIINKKPNGHFFIKGSYGSGKTSALVNKIPSLLEKYCLKKSDKVLVVSSDENDVQNFKKKYYDLIENKYCQSSFFYVKDDAKLSFNSISELINSYSSNYIKKSAKNFEKASFEECSNALEEALSVVRLNNKKMLILKEENFNFIKDEIAYIKNWGYLREEDYITADRKGRIVNENEPKVVRKNSAQRRVLFEVFREYNKKLKDINKIDSDDFKILALKEAKKKTSKKYTHILIDNCEKLTKIELEFLKNLYNEGEYSSIIFAANIAKDSYKTSWIKKSRLFDAIGYVMKGRTINLENISEKSTHKDTYGKINDLQEADNYDLFNYAVESAASSSVEDGKNNELDVIEYIDLKRNVSHKFIRDYDYENELYIKDEGLEEKVDDICTIPVFNEIAAGSPILINDSFQDNYILPKAWIRNEKDTFILKIKGDSMINKNIHDGDFVVIKKQNVANIGDVVAVDIAGEATLKTYRKIYGKIALMPENEKYEPIMIEEDQEFGFLGVAVGVIKNI